MMMYFIPASFANRAIAIASNLTGVKLLGQVSILENRDPGHSWMHDPFANAVVRFPVNFVRQLRIESPMNEHGIVAVREQLTAFASEARSLTTDLPHSASISCENRDADNAVKVNTIRQQESNRFGITSFFAG